mgnify:CR=1 FL=1
MKKQYLILDRVEGALIELSKVHEVGYGEIAEIEDKDGDKKLGRIIKIDKDKAVVQVFGSTLGLSVENAKVSFKGKPFEIPLSQQEEIPPPTHFHHYLIRYRHKQYL